MKKKTTAARAPRIRPLREEETIIGATIGWQKTGDKKGRGVFARRNLRKGEVIEISPVIPVASNAVRLNGEAPDGYLLMWNEDDKDEKYCMPLGYVMLYNHSSTPNIGLESDFRKKEMTVTALRDIKRGEELMWDYNCEIWF